MPVVHYIKCQPSLNLPSFNPVKFTIDVVPPYYIMKWLTEARLTVKNEKIRQLLQYAQCVTYIIRDDNMKTNEILVGMKLIRKISVSLMIR